MLRIDFNSKQEEKIIKTIVSCNTIEQLDSCYNWLWNLHKNYIISAGIMNIYNFKRGTLCN